MEITFIKKVVATNSFNEDAEGVWVPVTTNPTVFARVVEKSRPKGNEVVIGDRIVSVRLTIFSTEWRNDITPEDHRIVFDGRVFNIVQVVEGMARRSSLDITAELVDNEVWT